MDQKFIEKAFVELREDESRKTQSLAQFREWLAKHPFLSKTRQDSPYLLQFLRVRKYNVDEAFQTFERHYLSRKRYPQFFDLKAEDFEKLHEMLKTGFCVPLRGRDREGQKIVLLRTGKWDPEVFSCYDALRVLCYVIAALVEEEETQIAGVAMVFDHAGAKVKHLMSPVDLRDFMDFVKKCALCRQKAFYVINMPSFANFIMEIFKSALSEKLRKRLFLLKSSDDLKNVVDVNLLPTEYGGTVPIQEMLDEFLKYREQHRENLRKLLETDIDWSKVPLERIWSKEEAEVVGSFRKLEID